uniref:DNA repair and recombination protein RAD54-like n=1 Tax=Haptolina ericina TaxID=156174 RepID=A0A7S3APU5_9EUKA|mmetsp:Transcript_28383/g.64281  ORF Transcript_28383/g.64281 Transcript_28383/m.64281 type:complete len:534 (+) Transcript_28383:55-1656(+)
MLICSWDKEIKHWLPGALANRCVIMSSMSSEKQTQQINSFQVAKANGLLILSYETLSRNIEHLKRKGPYQPYGLLVCDEAHRLKNPETIQFKALYDLPTVSRIMISGTPVQNVLKEFHALIDFCIPQCLGDTKAFNKTFGRPIERARDVGATDKELTRGKEANDLFNAHVKEIMLRRTNETIAKFLPPKEDVVVFCTLTKRQQQLYTETCQNNAVSSFVRISNLKKIVNHPSMLQLGDDAPKQSFRGRPPPFDYSQSGKMLVLMDLLESVKRRTSDRFVLISNFTSTLDLFQQMLDQKKLTWVRLDGSANANKRQTIVDNFNGDPSCFCFLLSSKAGGCGINLIGGNRLILFDPDWNPATDQQALARVWRSGQKKKCFIYRFFATGSVEEVVYERQLSKEGLAGQVVDDNSEARKFSSEELRQLFRPNFATFSSMHDSMGCTCCETVAEPSSVLPEHGSTTSVDENGFLHLKPGSHELLAKDECLGCVQRHVSLVFVRTTDLTSQAPPPARCEEVEEDEMGVSDDADETDDVD